MRGRWLTAVAVGLGLAGGLMGAGEASAAGEATAAQAAARDARAVDLQEAFDHIGAQVHSLEGAGRTSYYIDEGEPGDRAVVFIGGQGTSLEAFQLTEFTRSSRQELGLRVISVERNGFGESAFDPALGYADYTAEVLGVLEHLGVERFAILAISGGGAYAAHLAARVPERVISLHAAAAVDRTLPGRTPLAACGRTVEELNAANAQYTRFPKVWWGIAPGSPVLAVPGWQAVAYNDAGRAFFARGQLGAPDALTHEGRLPCGPDGIADAARITAPTYLYWGTEDTAVPLSALAVWRAALRNVVRARVYEGEGHTVQYRHWDQILADLAGWGDHTVLCRGGRTRLVPERRAERLVARGATLGLCAWAEGGTSAR